jgi:2-isopropylmalate synthase
MDFNRYRPFPAINLSNRKWPGRSITKAPIWCSVDLRDGNQALVTPMNLAQKLEFFRFLTRVGFREIEIGFPAASETEYRFTRALIEGGLIPDGVVIQVLTQSREHIIRKTFEALDGVKKAVVHLYNSTSVLQRDVVFEKNKTEITEIAVSGAALINKLAEEYGREHFIYEYSPESFTGTELDYALEICEAVLDVWKPSPNNKAIINLPSTVEMSTPNVYADQVEYMNDRLAYRDSIWLSLHTHNDRGTAVAASELGLMAGAERAEGTLFGNGERTGNADILNMALNMYTQGIDPGLDFSHIDDMVDLYERSTGISVHPRHPYAGSLVYTAFSGSHQDAINKGMAKMKEHPNRWEVPYLPIDPQDVGRSYYPIIRINSQSGKGGVAYVLEQRYGIALPKSMQPYVAARVQKHAEDTGFELQPEQIHDLFMKEYVNLESPMSLLRYNEKTNGETIVEAELRLNGDIRKISGRGEGILDSFCMALRNELKLDFEIIQYSEHSLEYSSRARAITYVEISDVTGGKVFGAGISSSISKSSLRAVVSAVNQII